MLHIKIWRIFFKTILNKKYFRYKGKNIYWIWLKSLKELVEGFLPEFCFHDLLFKVSSGNFRISRKRYDPQNVNFQKLKNVSTEKWFMKLMLIL